MYDVSAACHIYGDISYMMCRFVYVWACIIYIKALGTYSFMYHTSVHYIIMYQHVPYMSIQY